MYQWQKNFWIEDTILDDTWTSPCGKYNLKPEITGTSPKRRYSIRGFYKIDYDKNDYGYKKLAIKEIENLFACYSLNGYFRAPTIQYFTPDDPMSPDAKSVPIRVGPVPLGVKPRYNKALFDNAYILYQKIKTNRNYEIYERCIRWFKKGLMRTLVQDDFISLWISFNIFYDNYYHENNITTGWPGETRMMNYLINNFFEETTSQALFTRSSRFQSDVQYFANNFQGRYTSRRHDPTHDLHINLGRSQFHQALRGLIFSLYGIRNDLFHAGLALNEIALSAITYGKSLLPQIIQDCILRTFP